MSFISKIRLECKFFERSPSLFHSVIDTSDQWHPFTHLIEQQQPTTNVWIALFIWALSLLAGNFIVWINNMSFLFFYCRHLLQFLLIQLKALCQFETWPSTPTLSSRSYQKNGIFKQHRCHACFLDPKPWAPDVHLKVWGSPRYTVTPSCKIEAACFSTLPSLRTTRSVPTSLTRTMTLRMYPMVSMKPYRVASWWITTTFRNTWSKFTKTPKIVWYPIYSGESTRKILLLTI